jgi:hypothetical protein
MRNEISEKVKNPIIISLLLKKSNFTFFFNEDYLSSEKVIFFERKKAC